ncbi:MAG: inner membrane-spanning protein YciB [Steroidobacterales bacterium]
MNQILEWLPLLAFFVVFKLFGIYWATATLMAACLVQLFTHRYRTGKYKPLHVATVSVVLVLGSATLLLHDKRFIQWKPTILLGATAIAFLGSAVFGRQPLARRMLESAFSEPLSVEPRAWNRLNLLWAAWFAVLAVANIYVARNFAESVWVNFKVFGISAAMIVFMIPQVVWLSGKTKPAPAEGT